MRKSKGYAKGGAKMMRARGGRMASKGYAKGGAKMNKASAGMSIKRGTKQMSATQLKNMAKKLGFKVVKVSNKKLSNKK